ncbi:helix-turn-helix domain-containing protein [Roseomonas sp. F4]
MTQGRDVLDGHEAALRLLRDLRRLDGHTGVRNSRIAFDVGLLLYEEILASGSGAALSVDQLAAASGYSGPTVRLVLKRLDQAGTVEASRRIGKTQLYGLTPEGETGFAAYVKAILAFRLS